MTRSFKTARFGWQQRIDYSSSYVQASLNFDSLTTALLRVQAYAQLQPILSAAP